MTQVPCYTLMPYYTPWYRRIISDIKLDVISATPTEARALHPCRTPDPSGTLSVDTGPAAVPAQLILLFTSPMSILVIYAGYPRTMGRFL